MSDAPPRRPKQEQEPASTEVVEVAPNVLRLQIPINFTGLGHVNSYALMDDRGATIVDVGLPGNETWSAFKTRLAAAGLKVKDVHTVVITHSHPDHFGSAGRLADAAQAEVITQKRFHTWLEPQHEPGKAHNHLHADAETAADSPDPAPAGMAADDTGEAEDDDTGYLSRIQRDRRTPWGGQPFVMGRRQRVMRELGRRGLVRSLKAPVPTRRVVHGDVLQLAGREWRAVHTPGHTGDHLCLYDPTESLLISGDHVLPSITPHVGGIGPLEDPLGEFLRSLAIAIDVGPVGNVLPAHGHPFADLRGRVDQIVDHHDERLASLRKISAEGGRMTVIEMSQQLFRRPVWGMMAESETYAHLEFLRLRGEAERSESPDGQLSYLVDPGGTSSARQAAFGSGSA